MCGPRGLSHRRELAPLLLLVFNRAFFIPQESTTMVSDVPGQR